MSPHAHTHTAVAPAEVLDPVCGMTISPDDAVGHADYKGQTYYFCSESCLESFRATPDAFLGERPSVPVTAADMDREYTCPMVIRSPYGGGIRGGHYHSQSSEAYCRAAETAFGTTAQSVGTMRTHWPVANSSTM